MDAFVQDRKKNGATSRTRTDDLLFTKQLLYHLSYRGVRLFLNHIMGKGVEISSAIMCYMERVGIRELRQNLSVYLRKVKEGETFEVTERGQPVAVLKRADPDPYQRLVDEGVIKPPKNPHWDLPPPVGEIDHDKTVSKYLQEMREDRI